MALAKRVIACLDVSHGRVVKGVNFTGLVDAGDPVELSRCYGQEGIDELVFLDVSATVEDRGMIIDVVKRTADEIFIPLTVGGGIRSSADVDALLRSGADKVSINTAAVHNPELISSLCKIFGSQCIVLSVDVRRTTNQQCPSGFEVTTHGGRNGTGIDAIWWMTKAADDGAGEILLNSIDADGTGNGFDVELISLARRYVSIPLIASGGAGELHHFSPALAAGADAVLAAGVFHFGKLTIPQVKQELAHAGHCVRL